MNEITVLEALIILFLFIVKMVVMTINFIGYTVVPELKNNHGLAIRCYIITYIISPIMYSLTIIIILANFQPEYFIGLIIAIIAHYSNISSALWLQVISFDIWWTFRNLRYVDCRVRERRNGKFIWYALYAGVLPIILGIPGFISSTWYQMGEVGDLESNTLILLDNLPLYIETAIYAAVCLCNIFFCVSMFCTMRSKKKETAALAEGSNQRHGAQKQWLNVYVKLSLIMGIHIIAWIFLLFTDLIPRLAWIYQVSELLHSILMFRFFLWKDGVKQTFRKRICSAVSCCSRKISSGVDNPISSPLPDSEPEEALPRF